MLLNRLFEIFCLGLIFYMLSPLAGFAFYFCMVHTPRHLLRVWGHLDRQNFKRRSMVPMALGFTCASWVAGGIALWMIPLAMSADEHLLRVIFIGLAALTVPHMLLVDGLFRRQQLARMGMPDKIGLSGGQYSPDSTQDNKPGGYNDA